MFCLNETNCLGVFINANKRSPQYAGQCSAVVVIMSQFVKINPFHGVNCTDAISYTALNLSSLHCTALHFTAIHCSTLQ